MKKTLLAASAVLAAAFAFADAAKDDCVSGGPDTKHLNEKGKYLQACVWLQTLFPKVDVTKISYNGKFKPEFAKLARACARDAAAK